MPWHNGLNRWWDKTLTVTTATVVTSILEYKESTVTTSSTIQNPDATSSLWSEVPTSLINGLLTSTKFAFEPTITTGWEDQVIVNPTPFVEVSLILYAPGSIATESGTPTCVPMDLGGPPENFWSILDTPYVFVPTPTTVWEGPAYVTAPTGVLDAWIAQEPAITEKYPDLTKCQPYAGTGEPTIHIPVEAKTEHSTTTVSVYG